MSLLKAEKLYTQREREREKESGAGSSGSSHRAVAVRVPRAEEKRRGERETPARPRIPPFVIPPLRTVVGYGVPGSWIRGEGPWARDGGIGVGRGPRRGWRALPSSALQRQVRAALRLLLLLHALLRAGPRVRAVLQALARAHHVADAGDDRVMGDRGGRRVMGAVRTRGRRHVRRRTRQGCAGPAAATLVPAAAAASARLPVLHQHRHRHPSR